MNEIEKNLLNEIKEDHDYIVSLRRYFHIHPELSKYEFHTAEKIEEELDKLGIEHIRVAETGVVADIKGELPGEKKIILRADTDALPINEEHETSYKSNVPNVMHACGHDMHTAGLIGVARILAKNKDKFGGTVRLAFQPGEEVGYGGIKFVEAGVCKGYDRVFGLHSASYIDSGKIAVSEGPVNASVDWFKVTVFGRAAHITTPHLGIDSLYISTQIISTLQGIITKTINPAEPVLLGIGKMTSGTAYNIVSAKTEFEGTIRSYSETSRAHIIDMIKKISNDICDSYGATCSIEVADNTSVLVNDPLVTRSARVVCEDLFGKDNVVKKDTSLMGDDFAEFSKAIPGCYVFIGTHNIQIPETGVPHHDCHFDIDENVLNNSVATLLLYAYRYLNNLID